jgi:hypothetical protein
MAAPDWCPFLVIATAHRREANKPPHAPRMALHRGVAKFRNSGISPAATLLEADLCILCLGYLRWQGNL